MMKLNTLLSRKNLPRSWRWVKLGDVCKQDRKIVEPKSTLASRLLYLSLEHIESNSGKILREPTGPIQDEGKSTTFYFDKRHVLYGKLRPYLNKVALPDFEGRCTTELIPILPTAIDREFLAWVLRRKETVDVAMQEKTGSRMPRANMENLFALEIPLPPLDEQRRMANRLNEQLAAVEAVRKAAEEQLGAAYELPSSYFREAFLGITPLTASTYRDIPPKGWSWKKLTTIARLESGHTPSRYHAEWWGGTIPWLALPDIRLLDGKVAFETLEYTNELGIANSSARILPAGTVALSRTASVGFVTILGREMATSQDFVNWVCGPEVDPYFLMYLFLASRDYFRSISSGAIHKTVYMPTSKALEVCIPPIDEQEIIAQFLKEKLFSCEEIISTLESQLAEIDSLPASLLREAFSGF